jgi:ABC-type multidrug transport system fused ATPase/permease subunit
MLPTLQKILSLFTRRERRRIYWLLLSILLMGIFETTGIASIMPFMAVITNPGIIQQNQVLSFAYNYFNFSGDNEFIFFVGIGVLSVLLISNSFAAFTTWRLLRFAYLSGHNLSTRLFEKYLGNPYSFFLTHNSSELSKNVITEVHRIVAGILTPFMYIITRTVIALCILALLIAMDPLLALLIFMVCGGAYVVVFLLSKKRLATNGKISTQAQGQRFKIAGEGFGGIKDLKLLGREREYLRRYVEPSLSFATCESTNQVISTIPKYALETIVFGGMLLVILYLVEVKQNTAQILPLLGLYAFAGYRLMPGFNQIFQGLSHIRYHSAALNLIHDHINPAASLEKSKPEPEMKNRDKLGFAKAIKLTGITFAYSGGGPKIIDKLNLTIEANTTIAFVGKTGSGKTTLIDLILGLLPLDSGEISIDDTVVNGHNLRSWQKNIGYVPQHIYISDDTVARNIAFGVPDEEIDLEAVIKAGRIANIDDFVSKDLSHGYETVLGERGVRLSGGQRQRIGIARAVYHDPKVLILDEATSSLDGLTETVIMDAIHNLGHQKTIILIAHRLTTVTECDAIHVLDGGKIIASGNYQELLVSCEQFRNMTKLTKQKTS